MGKPSVLADIRKAKLLLKQQRALAAERRALRNTGHVTPDKETSEMQTEELKLKKIATRGG